MNREQPIFCDMTDAVDTPGERREEYRQLFDQAHLHSERTSSGVRHTFRRDAGVLEHLRDLTRREQSCCGFLRLELTVAGDEVHWDIGTDAGPMADVVVEDFFRLPETLADSGDSLPLRAVVQGRTG